MADKMVDVPEWINQELIQKTLRGGLKNPALVVEDYEITFATAVGDNFLSQMLRVKVSVKNGGKISVVMKICPPPGFMKELIDTCNFFSVEAKALSQTMPRIHNLLRTAGIHSKLSADVYLTQGPPHDLLAMEDLLEGGYRTANRHIGLDLAHMKLVLEELAVLHAGSLALIQEDKSVADSYEWGYWVPENRETITETMVKGLKALAGEIETWPGVDPKYPDLVRGAARNFFPKIFASYERRPGMNVILHGDCWTNNLMFKYNSSGQPTGMIFVDFQLTSHRSPVLDLLYLIFASPVQQIKLSKLDEFLQTYHAKLLDTAQRLNFTLDYTLKELKQEFKERLFYGFLVAAWIFPVTIPPPSEVVDCDQFFDDSEETEFANIRMFRGERFVREFPHLLPYFLENGAI